jgi:hypothetical protein
MVSLLAHSSAILETPVERLAVLPPVSLCLAIIALILLANVILAYLIVSTALQQLTVHSAQLTTSMIL